MSHFETGIPQVFIDILKAVTKVIYCLLQLVFVLTIGARAHAQCTVAWDQLISTEAAHSDCFRDPDGDILHFTKTWSPTGGWDGVEGFVRWRVTMTLGEDDDGYYINHPATTSRGIYISFISRTGSSWWTSHSALDRFKFVMFYPSTGTNPRPTIFNMPIHSDGIYRYRTFGPDTEAGGQGCDQFGNCTFNQSNGYPNHTYKEGSIAQNQWYFVVMSLETDRTKVYIWNQDGTMSGQYAQSLPATSTLLSQWNAQTWTTVRLLGYIEATTAGDQNAFMDIAHIRLTRTLPAPPAGFVRGTVPSPSPSPSPTISPPRRLEVR